MLGQLAAFVSASWSNIKMEIPCLFLTKYASATLVMHYILIALFQPPLLRLSSIFISPSSEHNRGLEEIYRVRKKWQIQTLCQDFFQFVTDFHQKIVLSLFINYVNDYFLKCVGGNPISLLARFSFNQCSWIVSNSFSPFSLDDANGNLIFCQSWGTQELLS